MVERFKRNATSPSGFRVEREERQGSALPRVSTCERTNSTDNQRLSWLATNGDPYRSRFAEEQNPPEPKEPLLTWGSLSSVDLRKR